MKINTAGLRWLGRSMIVIAAVVAAACSADTDSSFGPSRQRTVAGQIGERSDTGNALSVGGIKKDDRPVDLASCDSLAAPEGSKLVTRMFGRGVQIYRWTGASWQFVAPSATLYANEESNGVVATHYAGPTWESNSGSKVVASVSKRCQPDQNSIPWLLLKAVSNEGAGPFTHVTSIQRLSTVGGNAPATAGTTVGQEVKVPYTAEYVFYR